MGSRAALTEENFNTVEANDHTNGEYEGKTFIRTSVITTPLKLKEEKSADLSKIRSKDETPVKNSLPFKRRSLMRDMKWEGEKVEQGSTKHPMEMRSRKRSKLKAYYDYQEYYDFAEDLRFLFEDEQLPDLELRPRRKSRKKRTFVAMKRDLKQTHGERSKHSRMSTSMTDNANINRDSTSLSEGHFSTNTRPNLKKATPTSINLPICIKNLTSEDKSAGTCPNELSLAPSSCQVKGKKDTKPDIKMPRKRKSQSNADNVGVKCQKLTETTENKGSAEKPDSEKRRTVFPNLNCDKLREKRVSLKISCVIEKLDENGKFSSLRLKNSCSSGRDYEGSTVTRMALRRRHSTPALTSAVYQVDDVAKKISRSVSTPNGALRRKEPPNKGGKSQKCETHDWQDDVYSCDDISDSEFVDSPDSGFSSETSCSAVTPDGDSMASLNFTPTKCNEARPNSDEAKHRISRTSSSDSGINVSPLPGNAATPNEETQEEGEMRLILCQKSVLEAQRLEREAKQKQEEEMLRDKFQCKWVGCPSPFESRCGADLHSHLQKYHIENYCCKWKGCKFFEIQSRKLSFLQRHIGDHSGEKPFKCILDGCDASFSSLSSRKRHVEAHYSEVTLPKARVGGDLAGFPRYLLNSRRVKNKKKTLANRHDCMDNRTLGFIKNALVQNEIATAASDDVSSPAEMTFQAQVIGERTGKDGKKFVLVKWRPENMLPNEWVLKSNLREGKQVKKVELPWSTKAALKKLFFFGRKSYSRKPTSTKLSLLKSLF